MLAFNNKLSHFLRIRQFVFQCQEKRYSVGVVGVPFWKGQRKPGTDRAPDSLRAFNLLNKLKLVQSNVVDFGNLRLDLSDLSGAVAMSSGVPVSNPSEYIMSRMFASVSQSVQSLVKSDFVPVVIGGDHSIAAGSVHGTCSAVHQSGDDISLIWVDAHADANMEHTSVSGNFHGMPISFLVKDLPTPHRTLFRDFKPCLSAKNVAFIGLRDVELQELKLLKESNLAYFSMREVDRLGIAEVVARALDKVDPANRNKLHLSFDVDAVDPSLIASTGTPVSGGLSFREALTIGEMIHYTGRLATLDVVEFNPLQGTESQVQQSANYIIDIILSFFGKSRLGYYNVNNE